MIIIILLCISKIAHRLNRHKMRFGGNRPLCCIIDTIYLHLNRCHISNLVLYLFYFIYICNHRSTSSYWPTMKLQHIIRLFMLKICSYLRQTNAGVSD